ncbi:TPA: BppU family phage baseplate upper protein, partial [Enterococcus faecium]
MASSLYNLALDFSKELNYTKAIMARQGDKGITVTVKPFLNGLQMDTSGGTFTLKGTTPSNRYVDSVATNVTSEEVTFSLDGTFMSEAGYYKHCYVEYRKDNQILTTQDIIFFSLGVSDISQGQADEYVSQLEELIRKYNETFDAFMAEIKGRVDSLNKQITDLTSQAKTLQDKLDALKEEISKLGNLQVMYSNSIDFGGYDYSGNPNIAPVINDENVKSLNNTMTTVTGHGTYATAEKIGNDLTIGVGMVPWDRYDFSKLTVGKQYTLTIPIRINADYTGDISKLFIRIRCANTDGVVLVNTKMLPSNTPKEELVDISTTFTVPSTVQNSNNWYCQVGSSGDSDARGTVDIGYDVK